MNLQDLYDDPALWLALMDEYSSFCESCDNLLVDGEKFSAELCIDCYYEAIGNEIEKHPIVPGPR